MTDMNNDFLFYKRYTDIFLDATPRLEDFFKKIEPKVEIKENYSSMLLKIYQIYMIDVFPSCNVLVETQNFFSFSILCRSILDITVQLMWILDLKSPEKKQEAIELFLNFDGVGEYTNKKGEKKPTHQWQDLIIKERFDYDKIIKRLKLDCENKHMKSTFDYLSKIVHWNPKIINKLVGLQAGHLTFGPEKLNMFFIASSEFIRCSLSFIIIFIEHFYPNNADIYLKGATEIQNDFVTSLKKIKPD